MLKTTTYQCILSTTVAERLLSPSTFMSELWKKAKNQTKLCTMQTLLWNLLLNIHYLNPLPKVTFCPNKVNGCTTFFRKTLVSSDPVLLTLPVPLLSNTILILAMLNPPKRQHLALAITIVQKFERKSRRYYNTALPNPVLFLGPVLLY